MHKNEPTRGPEKRRCWKHLPRIKRKISDILSQNHATNKPLTTHKEEGSVSSKEDKTRERKRKWN